MVSLKSFFAMTTLVAQFCPSTLYLIFLILGIGRIYGRVKLEPASNTKCPESLLHRVVRSPDLEWGNNNPTNSAAPNLTTTTTTPPPIRPKDNAEETNGDFLENALIPKDYTVYSIPWPSDVFSNPGYNFTPTTGFPFPVFVGLFIQTIQEIDEVNQRIALELEMTMYWHDYVISKHVLGDDNRTDYTLHNLNAEFLKRIWKPDLIFEHVTKISQQRLISDPVLLRFQQTNFDHVTQKNQFLFQYTTRLIITLACSMDFQFYPADTQSCPIKIRSFGYFTHAMRVHWAGATFLDRDDPNFDLQLTPSEKLLRSTRVGVTDQYFDVEILKVSILARRKLSYHMVQTYLPSIFFIVITWISFLVPSSMVEARIGISMTTLLTLTAMFSSVRESTPTVSYVKALDIWMVALIFFVFLTLFQFVLLVWLKSIQTKLQKRIDDTPVPKFKENSSQRISMSLENRNARGHTSTRDSQVTEELKSRIKRSKKLSKSIEVYSFWVFLVLFVLFTIVYWSWLITAAGYTHWTLNSTFNPETKNDL